MTEARDSRKRGKSAALTGPASAAWTLTVLAALSPTAASAQNGDAKYRESIGDYTVIYSAMRSDALPERMARRHGLPNNAEAVILNVTVERDGMNIPAMIDATVLNLAQQRRDMEMRETEANNYVSYVGAIEIAEREVLEFELEILPRNAEQPLRVQFRESFTPQTREQAEP